MATKPQNTVYRTAKGAQIDMLKLINQNELTPAVGNMGVNARGDKLGPGGTIIKKQEDLEMIRNRDTSGMDPEGNE
jgi:hypothetical protein